MHYGLLTFLLTFTILWAQQPETVLTLSWGSKDNQAGLRQAPDANYGPQSFAIHNSSLLLLDSENGWLKEFRKGKLIRKYPIPPYADDFQFLSEHNYLILSENTLYQYRNGQLTVLFRPEKPQELIESFHMMGTEKILCNLADGRHLLYSLRQGTTEAMESGWQLPDGSTLQLLRESTSLGKIVLNRHTIQEAVPEDNLASLRYLGRDGDHNLYIQYEFFVRQVPLRVRRELAVYSSRGNRLLTLDVPVNNYTYIFRDSYVTADGELYQMFTTSQGVEIVRWPLPRYFDAQNPPHLDYPDRFYQQIHYNELPPAPEPEQEESLRQRGGFDSYPQVIPEEALQRGDAYVQLLWYCSPANLTNGIIMDPYGYLVQTPEWIQIGLNQRVPYKWGGFEDLEQYVYGISIGKYAGDKYTNKPGGTPSAVGVDCSGFVSRCWNLPLHYSTRMMDDSLTVAYTSWLDAEPGDAVHKVGHVRLLVQHNGNGSLTVVEASGRDWRVNYHSYYYSNLTAYTPRYYVNRQGTPGNIPQPRLEYSIASGKTALRWAMGGQENTDAVRVYTSPDGNSWTLLQSLPDDYHSFSLVVPEGERRYFKLVSVSSEPGHPESKPSDVYGVYRNNNHPPVLIVDGFDRTTASYGKWPHIYHSFAVTVGNALYAYGIPFSTVDNDAVIEGKISLNNYDAVFWILGDESTHDGTFNKEEQHIVMEYLKQGGKLFVSGSEVGWDLVEKGTTYDQDFFQHYLKAHYVADNSFSYKVIGEAGTPFVDLTLHFDNGTHGIYKVGYPDIIQGNEGSHIGLRYANGYGAGIFYKGTFPDGCAPGRLVYLGFPFETIYRDSERVALMGRVLEFFQYLPPTTLEQQQQLRPTSFQLLGNYPNPFNGETRIRFRIPASGQVTVELFNTLGQRVLERTRIFSTAGEKEIPISSNGIASGVYFYRVTFQGKTTRTIRNASLIITR